MRPKGRFWGAWQTVTNDLAANYSNKVDQPSKTQRHSSDRRELKPATARLRGK